MDRWSKVAPTTTRAGGGYPVIDSGGQAVEAGKTDRRKGRQMEKADNDPLLFKALQNPNTGGEINPFLALTHPSLASLSTQNPSHCDRSTLVRLGCILQEQGRGEGTDTGTGEGLCRLNIDSVAATVPPQEKRGGGVPADRFAYCQRLGHSVIASYCVLRTAHIEETSVPTV